jgi:signal transduction histidine kinase
MSRVRPQPWVLYLIAGSAAVGLYYLLPWNSVAETVVYDSIGVSSAAAILWGAIRNAPAQRLPWYLFAAGQLAFAIGDAIFNLYADVLKQDPPVPSAADVFYLGGYPLLAAGLALLILRFQDAERRAWLIDAAMIATAFALVQWIFVMHDQVRAPGAASAKAVALSYPAMDIVLLSGLAVFFLAPTWRTVAYRYLFASVVLLVAADEINAVSGYSYVTTSWLDAGWLFSYVLWGVAALHPSMTALSGVGRVSRPRLSWPRLAMLAGVLLTAPVTLLIQRLAHAQVEALAIVICATALSALVLARFGGFITALDRLHAEERAARGEAESAHRIVQEQNERLREADRLKDEFVALISHDLRTPLTSIMGYLELTLEDPTLSDEQRDYLHVVERNSERLLHLVNDLLFVARLEAGEFELRPSDVDIAAVAQQIVHETAPRAQAKGVRLTCDVASVPELQVDKGRMFQLLGNLVSNAVKFTPEGGSVDVRVVLAEDCVAIEVSDTGIGIAAEEQRHLFDRFFRATSARDGQIPGTGLGLYIARAIVTAHGGKIGVRSELGRGTTFRIDLPTADVPAPVTAGVGA